MKTALLVPTLIALLGTPGAALPAGAVAVPVVPVVSAVSAADPCTDLGSHANTHILVSGKDEVRIRITGRRCDLELRTRGRVEYTADFRGIAGVSQDGEFVLEETADGVTRSLRLESDGQGRLETRYRVGRASQPFDAAAHEWLAERLLLLYRQGGLAAEQRAPWVLANSGLDGLIAEAGEVRGSSARRPYLALALEQPQLDPGRTALLLGSALPSSSSGKVDLLLLVAERHPMEGALGDAYLTAAGTISSSSGRRRALAASIEGGRASPELVRGVLRSASGISSSSERAGLLAEVATTYTLDDALLGAYLSAAADISSSSARAGALRAALSSQRLETPQLVRVLRAAADLSASSARADVLVEAAEHQRIEGAARAAYMDAALDIGARSHRDRAIQALERATSGGRGSDA